MAQKEKCGFGLVGRLMKCQPFLARYTDTRVLGLTTSVDAFPTPVGIGQEFRISLGLGICEVGLRFLTVRSYRYICSECGAIGWGTRTRLPREWKFRPLGEVYHFFCPACSSSSTHLDRKEGAHA